MKKIVVICLAAMAMFITLSAAMEEYDRKSISVFRMSVAPEAVVMATQQDVDLVYKMLFDKFVGMGRFDYNPIPAGVTDPQQLFSIVKEYAAANIEERAAKQWDIKNDYYGSNFVTGENVDKIINGAYIFFPTLETFLITKKKDSDNFTASMKVRMDIYSAANSGTPDAPVWDAQLVATVSAVGSNALGALFDFNLSGKKKDMRTEAVKSATNGMLMFMEKEVRKVDAFTIKALVTKAEPKKDKISFNFGKNVGVNMDDAYTVGYFQKDDKGKEKFVETGFMKVRKINAQDSESQLLIVTNPKNEKEEDIFNEYDQVYEYPLVGLNIMVGGGVSSFKYWGDIAPGETIEDAEENISPCFGINIEYDIARFINIPELYLNVSADILTAQLGEDEASPSEEEISTVIAEFGLTKKFFTRKLGWYIGGDIGYMALTYTDASDTDYEYYSVGGKVKGGINYLLSKNLYFDAGAGFRFHGELTDEDGKEGEDGWLTPSGFVVRVGLGYTL
ncbi:MAG: hypothetical protein AB7V07_03845 [Candidatus Delongbacteria bacterium]